jgi:hypothetical protein
MASRDNKHCVYMHVDPDTQEIVYIGSGLPSRPWNSGGRNETHRLWLRYCQDRFGLARWASAGVRIHAERLSMVAARQMERALILEHAPRLNAHYEGACKPKKVNPYRRVIDGAPLEATIRHIAALHAQGVPAGKAVDRVKCGKHLVVAVYESLDRIVKG